MSGQRGSAKWTRIGPPLAFGPRADGTETGIGWSWKIRRGANEERFVRVEVTGGPFVVTDLPAKSRNAIRSRGASAIDAFLHQGDPPERIIVSADGVHARQDPPHLTDTRSQQSRGIAILGEQRLVPPTPAGSTIGSGPMPEPVVFDPPRGIRHLRKLDRRRGAWMPWALYRQLVRLPAIVAHADWGLNPRKRWVAIARLNATTDTYEIVAPSPAGDPATLLRRLAAQGDGSVLAGFDFPIGVPMPYAEAIGIKSLRSLLQLAGGREWRDFYRVAERPSDISLRRPFYPQRPGGCSQSHLVSGLGVASMQDLLRDCERATPTRRQACSLFWTLGGNQVGKAAITGWRDVLAPALQDEDLDLRLWPFDGTLEDLLGERVVVVETYPTEFYRHLGVVLKTGKRDPAARRSQASAFAEWRSQPMVQPHVVFSDEATATCLDGFGSGKDGEDPFDAFVGLLGMLNVVLGNRAPGWPLDPNRRAVEGWILGQNVFPSSA